MKRKIVIAVGLGLILLGLNDLWTHLASQKSPPLPIVTKKTAPPPETAGPARTLPHPFPDHDEPTVQSSGSDREIPRFVKVPPISLPPPIQDEPAEQARGLAPPDIYAALAIPEKEARLARDALRIQRETVSELSEALRESRISLSEFKAQLKKVGADTDANLRALLGEKKLLEWRAYQEANMVSELGELPAGSPPGGASPPPP